MAVSAALPDTTYVPLPTACALASTVMSGVPGRRLATLVVRGAGPKFGAQGGQRGGCSIPGDAVAISATVSASAATAAGSISAFAAGSPEPAQEAVVSFGPGTSASSSVEVALCGPVAACGGRELTLGVTGGSARVTVDANGYFTGASLVDIRADLQAIHDAIQVFGGRVGELVNSVDRLKFDVGVAAPVPTGLFKAVASLDAALSSRLGAVSSRLDAQSVRIDGLAVNERITSDNGAVHAGDATGLVHSTGSYSIQFVNSGDLSTCTWQVSTTAMKRNAIIFAPGAHGVTVLTFDENWAAKDSTFDLTGSCTK